MRRFISITAILFLVGFTASSACAAEEYFVVKSRSGVLRVVDHKPSGGATIVKGPFKTSGEAEKAMNQSPETKSPGAKR
ncbi:MAG: hypothetical protein V2B18_01495 [Pseudomonadota bacterium]